MHISKRVHIRRRVEAVALPNHIGEKWCRTSDVTRKVRAGRRHGPRVAVPCRHDQTASPDRLRASRYSFFVDVCIVSLSGKSQSCVSVCNVEMQCLLAKWLILSLVLSFGTSLDRSCICADRIARTRFQWVATPYQRAQAQCRHRDTLPVCVCIVAMLRGGGQLVCPPPKSHGGALPVWHPHGVDYESNQLIHYYTT